MTWCGAPSPLPRMLACPPSCASVWPLFVSIRSVHVRKTLDSCIPTQCTRQIFIKIKKKDCIAVRQDEWTYVARFMVQYSVKRFFFYYYDPYLWGLKQGEELPMNHNKPNWIWLTWFPCSLTYGVREQERSCQTKHNKSNLIWLTWFPYALNYVVRKEERSCQW